MIIVRIQPLAAADNAAALALWEANVRVTHSFVAEEHVLQYKDMVAGILRDRPLDFYGLYSVPEGRLLAFMGVADKDLGVLFVAIDQRGQGYGTQLTRYAVDKLGVRTVDVNEQNTAARAFYEARGFVVHDHSPVDGVGNPYPLLHMRLK